MTREDEIVQRLDKLVAIQQIAYRAALESARVSIRVDKVNAANLDTPTKFHP